MKIDWCARLRDLASGKLSGEIPSIEYALVADELEKLNAENIRLRGELSQCCKQPEAAASELWDAQHDWKPIETIPKFKFVWAYCLDAHKTEGAAFETNGGMVVCHVPKDDFLDEKFIDHLGIKLNWDFTHWRELHSAPRIECENHDFKLHPIAGNGWYCSKCGAVEFHDD